MRSRSRDRGSYGTDRSRGNRDGDRRDRSHDRSNNRSGDKPHIRNDRVGDRDYRRSDGGLRREDRGRSNSRSRSRDRVRNRERMNDASKEFREVKRILTNPDDSKSDRKRENERILDNKERGKEDRKEGSAPSAISGRKTSYDEYNRRDGDNNGQKEIKRVRYEGTFNDEDSNKQDKNSSKTTISSSGNNSQTPFSEAKKTHEATDVIKTEEAYDDKELREIEQFLAKTAKPTGTVVMGAAKEVPLRSGAATMVKPTMTAELPAHATTTVESDDEEVSLVWEDEEAVAQREAQQAEERRRKRAEIANKYSNPAAAGGGGANPLPPAAPLMSPPRANATKSALDGTRGLPSPKAVVPVFDFATNTNNDTNANTSDNNDTDNKNKATSSAAPVDLVSALTDRHHGNSSLTIPTASLHLAKLALDGEQDGEAEGQGQGDGGGGNDSDHNNNSGEKNAAAAAADISKTEEVQPLRQPSSDEVERQQLENERAAVLQEERRERGMSDVSLGGYSNGYGAGGRVEFDMFSASPSGIEDTLNVGRKGQAVVNPGRQLLREQLLDNNNITHTDLEIAHLASNWDDGEGYYKARIGECIGDRFRILGVVGKGVFSTVLKCLDLRSSHSTSNNNGGVHSNGGHLSTAITNTASAAATATEEAAHVAIKMIRNNDTMRKAAEKEKSILLELAQHDPQHTKYCVRLLTHLEYKHHVAMVFEYQSMNLRETLKKFGKDVGINIGAIKMYGRQLLVALEYLSKLKIVHADIKLDNILCSGDLKQIKLCDFGSAFRETDTDNDPTPYLVSRFYRAPEIILGMPYDRAIDLWSVCVCLYELFTGHVQFPGRTNNEMLKLMMAVKGKFQNKQIKTHMRAYEVLSLEPHFDPDLRFRQYEADPITGKTILRLIDVQQPSRDLSSVLRSSKAGADDMTLVTRFTDLLEKGLNLDPSKRLTVTEALRHPFFHSSSSAK